MKRSAEPSPNPSGICMCGCGRKTEIAKQSKTRTGAVKGHPQRFVKGHGRFGEKHSSWSNHPSYQAVHKWVRKHKMKTGMCIRCKHNKETEWANLSGEYKRDVDDYIELCRTCHSWFDRTGRL